MAERRDSTERLVLAYWSRCRSARTRGPVTSDLPSNQRRSPVKTHGLPLIPWFQRGFGLPSSRPVWG